MRSLALFVNMATKRKAVIQDTEILAIFIDSSSESDQFVSDYKSSDSELVNNEIEQELYSSESISLRKTSFRFMRRKQIKNNKREKMENCKDTQIGTCKRYNIKDKTQEKDIGCGYIVIVLILFSSETERSEKGVAADIDKASVNTSDSYRDRINLEDQDNPPQPLDIYAGVPGLKSPPPCPPHLSSDSKLKLMLSNNYYKSSSNFVIEKKNQSTDLREKILKPQFHRRGVWNYPSISKNKKSEKINFLKISSKDLVTNSFNIIHLMEILNIP
uniref:Uncharacterized protein n=1 Tax=Timema bartmani TaxID=61472 RepID=A0A7R9I3L4_9NEOP|nr:unnamed protein product [Timema bartmani]